MSENKTGVNADKERERMKTCTWAEDADGNWRQITGCDNGSIGKCCSMPCPKCGSEDIHRRYRRKDEEWNKDICDYECRETERVEYRTYHARAKAECLVHHCRCCGYEWDSECESNARGDSLPPRKETNG